MFTRKNVFLLKHFIYFKVLATCYFFVITGEKYYYQFLSEHCLNANCSFFQCSLIDTTCNVTNICAFVKLDTLLTMQVNYAF